MIKDDDLLELVIEDNTIPITDNVKTFKPRKNTKLSEEVSHEDVMSEGMDFFSQQVADGAKGFFAIVFDKDFQPQIVWTGEIELIPALGALELAKNEILNNIFIDVE